MVLAPFLFHLVKYQRPKTFEYLPFYILPFKASKKWFKCRKLNEIWSSIRWKAV